MDDTMLHHESSDLQFAPLFKHFDILKLTDRERDNALTWYMYMYHDEKNHYWYKHSGSREYVVVNEHGTRQRGRIDTNEW